VGVSVRNKHDLFMAHGSVEFSLHEIDLTLLSKATNPMSSSNQENKLNSTQFILYSPISKITNLPQRALQSVDMRHP